jgi:hypothetical protein
MKIIEKILDWTTRRKEGFKQSLQNGEGGHYYSSWKLLDDLEIFIITETKEENQKQIFLRLYGIDCSGRLVFKEINKNNFYGSMIKLYSRNGEVGTPPDIKSEDLVYFGNTFGCEPMGSPCPDNEKWIIIK